MAGIGIYLRQAREKKGYSLEEMNRLTNIHLEYLYALENDQFDQLPSPFYARAFLRTYAKSLGLETQPLLDLFEKQNQTPVSPVMNQRTTSYTSMSASENNLQESISEPTYPSQPRSLLHTSPRQQKVHLTAAPPPNAAMKEELPSSPASHTNSFPKLHKPFSSQTLPPRRVAIEAKHGSEESKSDKKRKKSASRLTVVIAIGALLLVGGIGTYFAVGSNTPASVERPAGNTGTGVGDINANPQNTLRLIEGDVSMVVLIFCSILVIVGISGLVYINLKAFKKDNTPNQTPTSPNNEIPTPSTERQQKETNHTNVTQPSTSSVKPELRPDQAQEESGLSDREYREALRRGYLTQSESLVKEQNDSKYSDAQYREALRKMYKREK